LQNWCFFYAQILPFGRIFFLEAEINQFQRRVFLLSTISFMPSTGIKGCHSHQGYPKNYSPLIAFFNPISIK